ncbi:hypothetical protein T492DRAFT_847586 [Pavlovales sp. CCMP2436]|nr:hypothetical protein T492DRAFT_847586 [Pavlovales sp. CCMP2436]
MRTPSSLLAARDPRSHANEAGGGSSSDEEDSDGLSLPGGVAGAGGALDVRALARSCKNARLGAPPAFLRARGVTRLELRATAGGGEDNESDLAIFLWLVATLATAIAAGVFLKEPPGMIALTILALSAGYSVPAVSYGGWGGGGTLQIPTVSKASLLILIIFALSAGYSVPAVSYDIAPSSSRRRHEW